MLKKLLKIRYLSDIVFLCWHTAWIVLLFLWIQPTLIPQIQQIVSDGGKPELYLQLVYLSVYTPLFGLIIWGVFLFTKYWKLRLYISAIEFSFLFIFAINFLFPLQFAVFSKLFIIIIISGHILTAILLLSKKSNNQKQQEKNLTIYNILHISSFYGSVISFFTSFYSVIIYLFFSIPVVVYLIIKLFTISSSLSNWGVSNSFSNILFAEFFGWSSVVMLLFFPISFLFGQWISLYKSGTNVLNRNSKLTFFTVLGFGIFTPIILTLATIPNGSNQIHKSISNQIINKQNTYSKIRENEINYRKALLNGYLAGTQYWGTTRNYNAIQLIFKYLLNVPENETKDLQQIFNVIFRPFLYKGTRFDIIAMKSENLYKSWFDLSIQSAENQKIVNSLKDCMKNDLNELSELNMGLNNVFLQKQFISYSEENSCVDLEIISTYKKNKKYTQDFALYIQMPPNAVFTGLEILNEKSEDVIFSAQNMRPGILSNYLLNDDYQNVSSYYLRQISNGIYELFVRMYGNLQTFKVKLKLKTLLSDNNKLYLPQVQQSRNVNTKIAHKLQVDDKIYENKSTEWLPKSITIQSKNIQYIPTLFYKDDFLLKAVPELKNSISKIDSKTCIFLDNSISMSQYYNQLKDLKDLNNIFTYVNGKIKKLKLSDNPDSIFVSGNSSLTFLVSYFMNNFDFSNINKLIIITDAFNDHIEINTINENVQYLMACPENKFPICFINSDKNITKIDFNYLKNNELKDYFFPYHWSITRTEKSDELMTKKTKDDIVFLPILLQYVEYFRFGNTANYIFNSRKYNIVNSSNCLVAGSFVTKLDKLKFISTKETNRLKTSEPIFTLY